MAPADYTITNFSTAPEAPGSVTVTDIRLIPSCGSSTPGCPAPDPNVFQLNGPFAGSGPPGATCPASYTVSVINPVTGEVRFTPVGSSPVLEVGQFCRISFTTTTLRVPSIDAAPGTPGVQTAVLGAAQGTAATGAQGTGFGTSFATVNAIPPSIVVAKTATPLSRPEPGGTFTFDVVVTNTGSQPVTITQLTDNIYGNVATQGTCTTAIGTVLPPGGTYSCSFVGSFTGGAPASQTDVVTATAVDAGGNTASASDDATVTLTSTPPSIVVAKTATPLSLPEPGGTFTFNVTVTNTSIRSVTITSLIDNIYGNVATKGTCVTAVGTQLPSGGTYNCSFPGVFIGSGGATQTDVVTATAFDANGNTASASDDATVTLTPVPPSITVVKTATPLSLPEPGGTFTFNVTVNNTSIRPVTITSLIDNIYGNIATQGTCTTAVGTTLPPDGTYSCSFPGVFTGSGGATQTDTVTANAVDSLGRPAVATDDAVVTLTSTAPSQPRPLLGDFNGDGQTDIAVWRPLNGTWYVRGISETVWGQSGDIPVPADYAGDSASELAVWRPSNGTWYIRGVSETVWGQTGDIPVPADYNGDGKADLAVFRPSNGTWYVKGISETVWGQSGDIPVAADYFGDAKADLAVWRPSNGTWYVRGFSETVWGQLGDTPVPANYGGDTKADLAVWRPSNGTWYVRGISETVWGQSGDVPVAADYNGGGGIDIAVWRPINATWYVRGISETLWGVSTDIPV